MAFKANDFQQITLNSSLFNLTQREHKIIQKTWAESFHNDVFPNINEDRFSVLYSTNSATRPANPINIVFGLLLIKEMFSSADSEAFESMLYDVRYQYALHTDSFEEQPVSKNTLSNFRCLLYDYQEKTGIDLVYEEITALGDKFVNLSNMSNRTLRMDSTMISSSCRRLTRLEIVFNCLERLIKKINLIAPHILNERFKVYLEKGHRNNTIYHCQEQSIDQKMTTLIYDAVNLKELCKNINCIEIEDEYQLFIRMFDDQTKTVDNNVAAKDNKEILPTSLQNPTDPDATFRNKSGKRNTGYTGNIAETFEEGKVFITDYDLQPNIYSDQQFAKDVLNSMEEQEEEKSIIIDGGYYSYNNNKLAESIHVELVPTALVGRSIGKDNYLGFDIDEYNKVVKQCPAGNAPISTEFKEGTYRARFDKKSCDCCPFQNECPVKKQKKSNLMEVKETTLHTQRQAKKMTEGEYKKIANQRAGIEGTNSALKRSYGLNHMPVRGRVRVKIWFGLKLGALNCKRLANI